MTPSKPTGLWVALGILIAATLLLIDYGNSEYPELEGGIRVVRYMSAKKQLSRSSFIALKKNNTASDFIDWMFSPLGSAEWPPSQNSLEFSPDELKMIRSSGIPTLPQNVSIVANKPDPRKGKQIVVKSDNVGGRIIVEGYIRPTEGPSITKNWKFIAP